MILALDLGSTTGYAFKDTGWVQSGVISLKHKGKFAPNGGELLFNHLALFREVTTIAVEKPHAGKFFASVKILFGLLGIVGLHCSIHKINLIEYSPKAIKKFWTGNGNADKDTMVEFTQTKYHHVTDHNESDAIALLELHLHKINSTKSNNEKTT